MSIIHGQLICDACGLPIMAEYHTDIVNDDIEHYHVACCPECSKESEEE